MKVNEIFGPTIQGEGKSAGMPTMFLRTSGCNLACVWCDTAYTWNWLGTPFLHPEKYDIKKEQHIWSCSDIVRILEFKGPNLKSLVISGGEPMLQQSEIVTLLKMLKNKNYRIEIETNGTVEPTDDFMALIDQINCSPKTSNSGLDNRIEMRERPGALRKLASCDKTFFKFVVRSEGDLPEIKSLISRCGMKNVYLMAESRTREDQDCLNNEVVRISRENNFIFSPRLHVLLWNGVRGL